MQNVLVTGGAGYIGSHACKALKRLGYTPIVFDNFSKGWRDAVKFGPYQEGDLRNKSDIRNVFQKYDPIGVMHFAALSLVGESTIMPASYWQNNVIGSLNLIETAIEYKCSNFIFSSTCATYGNQDGVILNERSQQLPDNTYGRTKHAVENLLVDYSKAFDINFVIFRYFNVAGASPDADIGEFHRPETHLIPSIFESIDGTRDELKICGTDYPTADGTCIRDYVHVCDIVDAHTLGLDWLRDNQSNRVFNLGTGHGFSVLEVIQKVEEVTGCKVPYFEGARRAGDSVKLVSGSELASKELGWKPVRSRLGLIIQDAWRWHQLGGYEM